jgi:formamidopyrimidine-DNA glycosylase
MIELPEAIVISQQIERTLGGWRIARAEAAHTPHKFAWYTGDPAEYNDRLAGKTIGPAAAIGGLITFEAGDMEVCVGAPVHYHAAGEPLPKKHQLLIAFEDGSAITSSAQMWGAFACHPIGTPAALFDIDHARTAPSPLSDAFDRAYFDALWDENTPKLSTKAFLATEQRVPGLGNGALQDILWMARLNPRLKMGDLAPAQVDAMFAQVKSVLAQMVAQGGRDTERDLFWQPGGYATILSAKTAGAPCPACGQAIVKEAYLGGSVYHCPACQPRP